MAVLVMVVRELAFRFLMPSKRDLAVATTNTKRKCVLYSIMILQRHNLLAY